MLRYLYIPEEDNASNYFEYSVKNNIQQIIHGDSDVLKNLLDDKSEVKVINIPEFRLFNNTNFVFPQNKEVELIFIDEFLLDEKYNSLDAFIYSVDINDPSIITLIEKIPMQYNNNFAFRILYTFKNYGEYIVKIMANFDNKEPKLIKKEEIIIYKENSEENNEFKF